MPTTTAYSSQGSALKVTISATPTEIVGVKGLTGPSVNWDIADITNLGSPGNFKEKKPLMKDPGTVTFSLVYDPAAATHLYLQASNLASASVLEAFTEVFSDTGAGTLTYSGYVTKFEYKLESNQILMVDVEVTVTGAVTFTP